MLPWYHLILAPPRGEALFWYGSFKAPIWEMPAGLHLALSHEKANEQSYTLSL